MKLEMGYIRVSDVRLGTESVFRDGVLTLDGEAVRSMILENDKIADVRLEIAKPGESARITPVKDVIQPRVKVEGPGGVFPGVVSKVDTVGSGKTLALEGMGVVTVGKIVGFQEGIIDMSGPGAAYTPFSGLINLVLVITPVEDLPPHEYEQAVRLAGLKTASWIGELVKDVVPERSVVYDLPNVREGMKLSYVYGVDAKKILPTILSPTELMDGAIISGNCVSACDKNTTYHHLNNGVVEDLYAKHGKELNFVGMIITNENVYLADKQRSSDYTAKLCEFLSLDGVIISQEGFGNPDTDLIMNCRKIEAKGIKTVIITDEYAGQDGRSQSLADSDPAADACITGGNANMRITLPPMDRVIGTLDYVTRIAGGNENSLQSDGSIVAELQVITGATNETGFNRLSAR